MVERSFYSTEHLKKLRTLITQKKGVWLKTMDTNLVGEIPSCAECGKQIAPDATFCRSCHAPIVRRYCPRCSKLVPENTASCCYCGASAKSTPRYVPDFTTWATIGIMLALAVGIFFMSNSSEVKSPPQVASQKPTQQEGQQARTPAIGAVRNVVAIRKTASASEAPVSPEEATQLNLSAHQLMTDGKYNEAIPLLQKALKAFSSSSKETAYKFILYNLGYSLRRTGRVQEAVPLLEQCVNVDQEWEKARQELGIARVRASVQ